MPNLKSLTNIQEARMLAKKKTAKPVFHKAGDMLKDVTRRHASKTTQNSILRKMKAKDPQGMLKYDNKRKYRSGITNKLQDNRYQRGLYDNI